MFNIINKDHKKMIEEFAGIAGGSSTADAVKSLEKIIYRIHSDIPDKKRISYGRYSIIKQLGLELYPELEKNKVNVYEMAIKIFEASETDQFIRSLAVQLISIYGHKTKDLKKVLPVFDKAAADSNWEARECSAGFIRKLVWEYPDELKKWYLEKAKSGNPMHRRFASESLRPVADNRWLLENPSFSFSIIKNLYKESDPYPRTSVGNHLSDWARHDSKRVYRIVKKLVDSGDKNSFWIACRACRNLIKEEPARVMDLLGVDEYKYKKRKYNRKDYP